jgi:hypothetical protein
MSPFEPLPEKLLLPIPGSGGLMRALTTRILPLLMLSMGFALASSAAFSDAFGSLKFLAVAMGVLLAGVAGAVLWGFGAARLLLDRQGFEYRLGQKAWRRSWADCTSIKLQNARSGGFVMITWKQEMATMAPLNAKPTLEDGFATSFGLKPKDLADVMNRFRARALAK